MLEAGYIHKAQFYQQDCLADVDDQILPCMSSIVLTVSVPLHALPLCRVKIFSHQSMLVSFAQMFVYCIVSGMDQGKLNAFEDGEALGGLM